MCVFKNLNIFSLSGCEQNSSVPLINVQITGSSFQMIDMNDLSALIATVQRINATAQSLGMFTVDWFILFFRQFIFTDT